jgi:hypothetical protein
MKMLETDAERLAFTQHILLELAEQSGGPWKEVWCEPQPRYNEMVFWVLLYEDSDLKETHKVFCSILARHVETMKPLEAYLSYEKLTDEGLIYVEAMKGNEAVFSALTKDQLGASPSPSGSNTGVFRSADSKR